MKILESKNLQMSQPSKGQGSPLIELALKEWRKKEKKRKTMLNELMKENTGCNCLQQR